MINDILRIGYNQIECVGSGTIYGIGYFALIWFLIGIGVSSIVYYLYIYYRMKTPKKQKDEIENNKGEKWYL